MVPYDVLVEQVPDSLTWHRADGRYVYVAPSFGELLGVDPADLVDVSPYELFFPEDIRRIRRVHEEALVAGRSFRIAYRIRRVDSTYLWVESTGRLVPPDGDRDAGIVVATRDIEARRSLLTTLEHERAVAEQLVRLTQQQDAFLTAIAHRTRTPMTSVLGFARTLERHGGSFTGDRFRSIVGRLIANAEQLARIIDESTTFERLSRGEALVRRRRVIVERLAHLAVEEIADPEQAPIEIDVPPDLVVMGEQHMLQRALRVLVHNAIVHTRPGTRIWVRARAVADGVEIAVEDDGPGVRPDLREVVFEPFRQGDTESPHDPGIGLGLPLVAAVAAQHGGAAWVTDREGGGASFRIHLPEIADGT